MRGVGGRRRGGIYIYKPFFSFFLFGVMYMCCCSDGVCQYNGECTVAIDGCCGQQ